MRQSKWITGLFVLLGLAFWAGAWWRVVPVLELQSEYELIPERISADVIEATDMRLPVEAMSIFRSLVINYLWTRIEDLKQEKQYFDANYMARIICQLQPHMADVWKFQAWNMAYNISVAMPRPEQRWEWVQRGIELLRDQGIPANPRSSTLHYELAWTLFHKCGGITDDHHRYYKLQFMGELDAILSPVTDQTLEQLAATPQSLEGFGSDPAIAVFLDRLSEVEGISDHEALIDQLWDLRLNAIGQRTDFGPYGAALSDPSVRELFSRLDFFMRARALRGKWKMDPQRMIEINQKFGPVDLDAEGEKIKGSLDWRHPSALTVYWAYRAMQLADFKKDFDRLQDHRVFYYALQGLFQTGKLNLFYGVQMVEDPDLKPGQEMVEKPEKLLMEVFESHDLRMFPSAYKSVKSVLKTWEELDSTKIETTANGAVNLLRDGIIQYYLAGHEKHAQTYLKELITEYPYKEITHNVSSLDQFVARELRKDVEDLTSTVARRRIWDLLIWAWRDYAFGEDDSSERKKRWAQEMHVAVIKDIEDIGRLDLPPFTEMVKLSLVAFMGSPYEMPPLKRALANRLSQEQPELHRWLMNEIARQEQAAQEQADETQ